MQYFYIKNIIIFIDKNYHSWYIITMTKTGNKLLKEYPTYISGPIASRIKLGTDWREPFIAAERSLRSLGYRQIHSPVDIAKGVEAACEALGRKAEYADYMKADLEILLKCHTIVMLKGWENSKGARLEYEIAEATGMEIVYER